MPATALSRAAAPAIDSVYYQDLNGDGRRELIVGWRISAEVQTVAVYTVAREPVALMSSGYTRFTIQDLNGDGIPSLLVLRTRRGQPAGGGVLRLAG